MTTDVTAPAKIDIDTCRQGSPFHYAMQLFDDDAGTQETDLTGWTFRMQLREGVADSNAPEIKLLSSEGDDPNIRFIAEASDGTPDLNGEPDPTNGWIYLHLTSAQTAALRSGKAPKPRQYPVELTFFYDIEATPPGGEPQALAFGTFTVACEVTREA